MLNEVSSLFFKVLRIMAESTPDIPDINRALDSIGNKEDRRLLIAALAGAGLIDVEIMGIQLGEFQCKLHRGQKFQ